MRNIVFKNHFNYSAPSGEKLNKSKNSVIHFFAARGATFEKIKKIETLRTSTFQDLSNNVSVFYVSVKSEVAKGGTYLNCAHHAIFPPNCVIF